MDLRNAGQQNRVAKICSALNIIKEKYSKIYIEYIGIQPYLFVASYCNITPQEFHNAKKVIAHDEDWDHVTQLDKYYFLTKSEIENIALNKKEKSLFVVTSKIENLKLLQQVNCAGLDVYFYEQ
jgi:hypothetical protein